MSSGFISEAEISEQRKRRQEEWDKVRTADQPLEAPETPYDPRNLYERLQEQKNKRDAEYEEAHKLKNMIKGLDDDEVEFLDLIDRTKMEEERKKNLEEEKEVQEFKAKVATLQEKSLEERLKHELKQPIVTNKSTNSSKNTQRMLLAGVVKKTNNPRNKSPTQGAKRKLSATEDTEQTKLSENATENQSVKRKLNEITVSANDPGVQTGALKCVAILPGMGSYDDSSDSDCSSDSEHSGCTGKKVDMLGRVIPPPKEKDVD